MKTEDASAVLTIWPEDSQDITGSEQELLNFSPLKVRIIRNVTIPTLTVYRPDPGLANGTGMIVCPGGGFEILAIDHEGIDVARWLNSQGITAFVLKYRLHTTPADDEEFLEYIQASDIDRSLKKGSLKDGLRLAAADAQQALKIVRQNASKWGVVPDRIGIIGFSAGGATAAEMAHNDDPASRPDFAASIYGTYWITERISDEAPSLFIALANDDPLGDLIIDPCIKLYKAWNKAGHPVELHIYAEGGHGFGMVKQGLPSDSWIERYGDWLRKRGLI